MKQIRKVMATVYFEYVVMRWKILRAPMMADTMTDRPGRVSTMSAAPRAASVAPAQATCFSDVSFTTLDMRAMLLPSKNHESRWTG